MLRYYNDYAIYVTKIDTDFGHGFSATAYIPKNTGVKENVREFTTYQRGIKATDVVEKMKQILDLGL